MTSAEMLAGDAFCLTSMSGDSPETCTLSVTPPTASDRSIFRIWPSSSAYVFDLDRLEALHDRRHLIHAG